MKHSEFLSIFRKHLRVVEPKRSSLIAELRGHLDELTPSQDPVSVLGYPMDLARKYNRTHIGLLGSLGLLLSLPTLVTLIIWSLFNPWTSFFQLPWTWMFLVGYIPLLLVLFISGWVGTALRRTHRPGFTLGAMVISSLLSPTLILLLIQYIAHLVDPHYGYLGGIFGQGYADPPMNAPFAWRYNLTMTFGMVLMGTIVASVIALITSGATTIYDTFWRRQERRRK